MKPKLTVAGLHNRYFGQRHGESHPNKLKIILSDPEHGKQKRYGLTRFGRSQVKDAAKNSNGAFQGNAVVISSNFSRTKDTAKITAQIMGAKHVKISHRLRERNFGVWEETVVSNYKKVWDEDRKNPNHRNHGGESINDVLKRLLSLIAELENDYTDTDILLISHGDPLQILQCFFHGIDPRKHRELRYFKTAEIRRLSPS